MSIEVSLAPIDDLSSLGQAWRDLEQRAEASFFQSWSWIGTWIALLPAELRPEVLAARRDGQVVGLCSLGRRTTWRHRFIVSHGLFLNQTGDPSLDVITIEHNGILADRRWAPEVVQRMLEHLVGEVRGWDELFLSGVRADETPLAHGRLAAACGLAIAPYETTPSRFVDLAALSRSGRDYLELLGSNTRYQIRRSQRRYEARGPLGLARAEGVPDALSAFGEMKALHQAYWTRRGQPGSFASPFFEAFHSALIERCVPTGEVELVRVAAGDQTIGVLYNFTWRGNVCNYQSGFAYEADNAIKPGFVAHALAVSHYLAEGAATYDFLAVDSQYKSSLATDAVTLAWLAARRPRVKYAIEEGLRRLKHRLARPRSPAPG